MLSLLSAYYTADDLLKYKFVDMSPSLLLAAHVIRVFQVPSAFSVLILLHGWKSIHKMEGTLGTEAWLLHFASYAIAVSTLEYL